MTREEFIDGYLERSGIQKYRTPAGYRVPGRDERVALPCSCGEDGCSGWAMILNDDLHSVANHLAREGIDPATLDWLPPAPLGPLDHRP